MCREVALTVETVGTGGMLCWFVTLRGGISVRCGGASTFGLGAGRVGKGPTGMGVGGRSF